MTNARSTVGTATEILDHLRLLYAKIGTTVCPDCERQVEPGTVEAVAGDPGVETPVRNDAKKALARVMYEQGEFMDAEIKHRASLVEAAVQRAMDKAHQEDEKRKKNPQPRTPTSETQTAGSVVLNTRITACSP